MMRRFVSIWFPYLATDWHARKQPALKDVPFVLKTPVHNRAVVTAACPRATALGIHPGTVLADARALHPGLQALDDKPGLAPQLLERIAEWCIRFTPVAATDAPAGILLDATGCAHLWGGEEAYLADIRRRLAARGYTVRAAMADTPGAAWALARYGNTHIAPAGAQKEALRPLPVAALRLDGDTVQRLNKLGLRHVFQLCDLARPALRRRFGDGIGQQLRRALGEEEEGVQPVCPPAPYVERLPCIEPIVTRTGIDMALERLLQALCARLAAEGKGLRAAVFRGYRVDGEEPGISINTGRPTHHVEHVFHLFSLKVDTIEPAMGIELFLLEATVVEDQDPAQQRLWEAAGGLAHPQVAELLDRLAARLGPHTLHRYLPAEHYWPERAFRPARELTESTGTEWKVDRPRPLHLLSPPERIEVTAPVPDYPPMLFRHRGTLHKVVRADGPERIEPEWWIGGGPHRDYYCLEDEVGRRYWVYREGHYTAERTEQWFLHGCFA
ncbi:DNA polymerase Y family protein [Flaviaesturariibacter flavus]|uniref:DNA polymerase Y family protein n=1 Tax=Flaviaesturariibacter flavus TaxID=2502780 RepID=A0A4R1B9I8_9BACT|nr:DNA polymerase Y family protein [Flaviaesturariibacter flavus]TCJ13575.1 DNA polymerase Y family protein [Flaviaesturariibacter flavus]